jgi:hypothetical protein
VDRGDAAERPPTTRIGPAGGSGGSLRTAIVLVAFALAVAVVKPWDWIAAPSVAPGREGAAILVAPPTSAKAAQSAPTPAPRDWTGAGPQVACTSGTSWLAVVDQVDGPTVSRSWTHLDLVPATDPLDPAIARTHAYADSVPRIGFCAPGSASAAGAPGASAQFRVRAWRLTPPKAAPAGSEAAPAGGTGAALPAPREAATGDARAALPGAREAVLVVLRVVSGGTAADGGALFGPPGWLTVGRGAGRAADPEGAWAARGPVPLPGDWTPGGGLPEARSWQPGTYVFHVDALGSGPAGSGVAWFAIELRGPWTGSSASSEPEQTP